MDGCLMKKILSIILGAVALVITASCAEEINGPGTADNGKETIITVIATDKPAVDEDSKTFIDGTSVKWSETGEYLKVYEVATPTEGDAITTSAVSSQGETTDSGATMTFGVSLADKSGGSYTAFDYYAVYPSSAVQSGSSVGGIALNTSASQTPSATNFDASQDLLIAKKVENGATQASTLLMQFARVVAIGKMTIKNLESEDPITKITFSAKVGDDQVALAGRTNFNLETAKPVSSYASNTQDYSIILNYEGQHITANSSSGMVAYFTCYPFEINSSTPGSFKVVVETETQIFTKEVNVSSAKGLAFNIGKASVFSVDMDNIEGDYKTVDLCYAYLEYSDVSSQLSNAYGNATVTKAHGDRWSTNASNANSSVIGLKKDDVSSYIKLPDFKDEISSVKITLSDVTAGNSLTIDPAQGTKTGDIATVAFVADQLEYTADLSEDHVHTAYLHAIGGQAKIVKVEVFAGTDTRDALASPTSVAAALNAEANNAIDVSWDAVDGAGSYLISLTDEGSNTIIRIAASSPYTVTGLEHEMEYGIGVKALPTDYYVNKESSIANAGTVTTGEGEVDYSTKYTTSEDVEITGGVNSHVSISAVSYDAAKANKGATLTITIPEGTTTLHLFIAAWNGEGGDGSEVTVTGGTIDEDTLVADSGVSGSGSTYTLAGTISDYYRTIIPSSSSTTSISIAFASGKRGVIWGVNPEVTPDTREEASLTWKKGGVEANSDTATMLTGEDTMPTIALDNSDHSHPVTYSSSNTGVATIVESGVGAGTITLVAAGQTTISAIFEGDEDYKPLTVSYTLTVYDNRTKVATPTFSPAAGEVAENSAVTISCATDGATIHYTVNGSTPTAESAVYSSAITIDAAKTIKAIAVKDDYQDSAVAEAAYTIPGASGGNVTDVLNRGLTGITGTTYTAWSGKKSNSDAVYAGQSAGGNGAIQLRSNNSNSGIVTTTSGGTLAKVTVVWNSSTDAGRTLNVYGKNTAYSDATDLYGDGAGTLLGTIVNGTSTQLIISGNYSYIGLRSASGAMYLDEIDIEWGEPIPTYAIAIDGGITHGSVSASPSGSQAEGTSIALTATPDVGYMLDAWDVYKTGDSSTKVEVTSNSFTMPAYGVTVSASFVAIPTISMNTTSIPGIAAAGTTTTASAAYNLLNGASNNDVTITCDGTIVTSASKNASAGNIDYTVAANTGAARVGWIKVKYGTEDAHQIDVSQLAAGGGGTKTYTLVLHASDFSTTSYAANDGDHVFTATAEDSSTMNVTINTSYVMQSSSSIQFKKSNGIMYNKTDLGSITGIATVAADNKTDVNIKYRGTSENPASDSGSGGYFKISTSATANLVSITIVFEK